MKKTAGIPRVYFAAAVAYAGALAALWIHAWLAAAVLGAFVLLCVAGAVFAQTGLFLPVITRGGKKGRGVALTFDDGPDPETTPALLDLLERFGVEATFFVTGRKAETHPEIIARILTGGHCIGNHTYSHDVWIMLKSAKTLEAEIEKTQNILMKSGIRPVAFRPPAGVVNPGLGGVLEKFQMHCILYSCRGPDLGNRRIKGLGARIGRKIKAGHIVLLHDGNPRTKGFDPDRWLAEMEAVLEAIAQKSLFIRPLSELTGRRLTHRQSMGFPGNKRTHDMSHP